VHGIVSYAHLSHNVHYGLDVAVVPSEGDLARFEQAGEPPNIHGLD
jgi:hypothetical protein